MTLEQWSQISDIVSTILTLIGLFGVGVITGYTIKISNKSVKSNQTNNQVNYNFGNVEEIQAKNTLDKINT